MWYLFKSINSQLKKMAYSSRYGKRPEEGASKIAHSHVINDTEVQRFIQNCTYPKSKEEVELDPALLIDVDYSQTNPVELLVAVDGGYSTVSVKKTFPSSTISFFQIGTLLLKSDDLNKLSEAPFIAPSAMSKLKDLERDKLVLPTKNVSYDGSLTLTESVRKSIYEYFKRKTDKSNLLETLFWFLYHRYDHPETKYQLASCPNCGESKVQLQAAHFNSDFINNQSCNCGKDIYLTDVFRFHEVVDDETGAGGILGYLTNILEHFNVLHTIKYILENKPKHLGNILFIKDGPLAFFGQTANLHKPMRHLNNYLIEKHDLLLVGLEKSGAFVEHADEIKDLLDPGQAYLFNNEHIYTYILPGDPDTAAPYGNTSYYSSKLLFKSREGRMHVVSIPVRNEQIVTNPQRSDFSNLDNILHNIELLRCDMYDNAIVPVALANKLISLSNHPSTIILEKFSKSGIS